MTTEVAHAANGNGGAPPVAQSRTGVLEELLGRTADIKEEIAGLDGERAEADAEFKAKVRELEAAHQERLGAIEHRRAQLSAVLEALGEAAPRTTRKRAQNGQGTSRPFHVSPRVMRAILAGCLAHPNGEEFSTPQIHEEVGADWSMSYTNHAFIRLRNQEAIGMVRREPGRGGAFLYHVLDRPRGEQILEEFSREPATTTSALDDRAMERVEEAVRETLDPQGFTAFELAEALGHGTPKSSYNLLRVMKAVGRVVEIEKVGDGTSGRKRGRYALREAVNA